MPKRVLVLNGHPAATSLNRSLAETYAEAATGAGHEVQILHVHDLDFDPNYGFAGYTRWKPLEPALERVLSAFEWSQHIVLVTPMWWGGLPGKLKGLFDRAFLPGRLFDPRNPNRFGMPTPLLTGRTGRILITTDTPAWFFRLRYGNALIRQLRGQIFEFVGIRPTRVSLFPMASHPKPGQVEGWLKQAASLGARAA